MMHNKDKHTEIQQAIQSILNGAADEIIVKNVRSDLEEYGGSNGIAFLKGTDKGVVSHFANKHKEDIDGIIDALINGKITGFMKNRKVYI